MSGAGADRQSWPADHGQAARLVGQHLGGGLDPIGEGDFCLAFRRGARVVRVAKHREAAEALRREACVLARIADHLPLPVPRPVFSRPAPGCAIAIHDEVRGSVLTRESWERLPAPVRESTARELAYFLAALHALPASIGVECDLPVLDRTRLARSLRTESGILHPSLPAETSRRLEEMLDRWSAPGESPPHSLLHRDLSPGHVLYDPSDGRLTGVIDFGDVALGDPARDFIFIHEDFGPELLAGVLRHYPGEDAATLLPRIHMWFLLETVEWTLARLRAGDLENVEDGVALIADELAFFTTGEG